MKSNFRIFLPYLPLAFAFLVLSIGESSGLDGAALSTAKVFWFGPIVIILGYMSLSSVGMCSYSMWKKFLITLIWVLPSIPLSIMSLMGTILLIETGFGIFF